MFIPGITGRLYQQFAVTIAISVLLSAFNALTLSPALSACCCGPAESAHEARWAGSSAGSIGRLAGHRRLHRVAGALIRKSGFSLLFLGRDGAGGRCLLGKRLPTGFLPEEDQGFVYVNVQLPVAASLERTDGGLQAGRGDCCWRRPESGLHDRHRASAC